MPRINLLPVRAARAAGNARRELAIFAGLFTATVLGLYGWYAGTELDIARRTAALAEVEEGLKAVEKAVAQVEDFKQKAQVLERKLEAIELLRRKKVGPAKMLSDVADIFTHHRKIWLTHFEERDGTLVLKGGAMEHEDIGAFQIALEEESKFFSAVTLTLVNSAKDGGVPYFQWALSCRANYAAG